MSGFSLPLRGVAGSRNARDMIWHSSAVMFPVLVVFYRRQFKSWPRIVRPRTFNEKLLFRMAFDRRPVLPAITGKFEARAYVAARLGGDVLLPRLLGVARHGADLDGMTLPESYIMKASHASGKVRIVTPQSPLEQGELSNLVADWLAIDYGKGKWEWCYKDLVPAVVFEELLLHHGQVPKDYKFFCFAGRPTYVQVDSSRFGRHTQTLFDKDWNRLDLQVNDNDRDREPPPRPACLDEMLRLAERLSAGLDFVRVDLFDVGGEIRIGELTPYPQGGRGIFKPARWDEEFGRRWRIPSWATLRGWRRHDRGGLGAKVRR